MVKTKTLKDWTDEEVIDEYKALYESVYVVECYSSSDLLNLYEVEGELAKRGYEARSRVPEVVKTT